MTNLIFKPDLSNALNIAMKECKDPYAQTYLRAIPQAIAESEAMGISAESGLKTQLLYCLSNMRYWKGETAKNCKAVLKRYSSSECPFIKGTDTVNN